MIILPAEYRRSRRLTLVAEAAIAVLSRSASVSSGWHGNGASHRISAMDAERSTEMPSDVGESFGTLVWWWWSQWTRKTCICARIEPGERLVQPSNVSDASELKRNAPSASSLRPAVSPYGQFVEKSSHDIVAFPVWVGRCLCGTARRCGASGSLQGLRSSSAVLISPLWSPLWNAPRKIVTLWGARGGTGRAGTNVAVDGQAVQLRTAPAKRVEWVRQVLCRTRIGNSQPKFVPN